MEKEEPLHPNEELKLSRRRVAELEQAKAKSQQVEEKLRLERDFNATLIQTAPLFFVAIAADGRTLMMNKAMLQALGYTADEVVDKDYLTTFVPERDRKVVSRIFATLATSQEPPLNKNSILTKSGRELLVEWHGRQIFKEDGALDFFFGIGVDITEAKRAEERIDYLNRVLRAVRNVNQLITREKDRDRLLQRACENLIETRAYHNVWIALLEQSGKLIATAEAGLGKAFAPLVAQLKRGELTACGQRALGQAGVLVTENPLSTCGDCPLAAKYADRAALTVRLEHGGTIYGLLSASIPGDLIGDEGGLSLFEEVAGDIAFALHDIELEERRKQAEEALRKADRALRVLSEGNQMMVRVREEAELLSEVCRIIVEVGQYPLAWIGFAQQDEGKTVRPVAQAGFEEGYLDTVNITWADTERGRGPTGTAIRTGRISIAQNILTDPQFAPWRDEVIERGYASSLALPLHVNDHVLGALNIFASEPDAFDADELKLLMELAEDTSYGIAALRSRAERKRAEEKLKAASERLDLAMDAGEHGFWDWNLDTDDVYFSPRYYTMLGYEPGELPMRLETWVDLLHPEDRETVVPRVQEYVENAQPYEIEFRLRTKDGGWRWISGRGKSFEKDEDGKPHRALGVHVDITARKRAEEEKQTLEAQLVQAQKLESIGTLASGVAHEINNPLTGIINYANLIESRIEDPKLKQFAQGIMKEGNRVAEIVKSLLYFSRQEKQSHSPARMEDIINSSLNLVGATLRKDQITIELEIPNDLPQVRCRSQQIEQVIINLLTNARDALNQRYHGYDENKLIKIIVRPFEKAGIEWVRTTVEDHGIGIPEDVIDRIFDPFFTTKPRTEGTGLGLSVSYGIVKEHHGELSVESEPGSYTRFHLDLPVDNGWNQK